MKTKGRRVKSRLCDYCNSPIASPQKAVKIKIRKHTYWVASRCADDIELGMTRRPTVMDKLEQIQP